MEYYSAIKRSETVPFAETCRDIETVIQNTVKSEKQVSYVHVYMWNLEKWYWWAFLQSRKRDPDMKNGHVDVGVDLEVGTHIYTLLLRCTLSRVWLSETPWTVAGQTPLSMRFSRQEYWSGLPCPSPGGLPDPEIEPASPVSPALSGGFFTTKPPEKLSYYTTMAKIES